MFSFQVEHNEAQSSARSGRINTPHGVIRTPVFMPVGTQGSVKALSWKIFNPWELKLS